MTLAAKKNAKVIPSRAKLLAQLRDAWSTCNALKKSSSSLESDTYALVLEQIAILGQVLSKSDNPPRAQANTVTIDLTPESEVKGMFPNAVYPCPS
jgi:hypothetical protein